MRDEEAKKLSAQRGRDVDGVTEHQLVWR